MTRPFLRSLVSTSTLVALLGGAACQPPPGAGGVEPGQQALSIGREAFGNPRTVGENGREVTLRVWHCWNWDMVAHPTVSCSVDPGWVLVGGGAQTSGGAPGALLTASYPDLGLVTWTGASKDHIESFPHQLHVFAHGIQVKDLPADTLRQFLTVKTGTSDLVAHPTVQLGQEPSDKWRLSSGARVDYGDGAGNLLYSIFAGSVGSKDHFVPSPARITMYQVLIARQLPGGIRVAMNESYTTVDEVLSGPASATARVLPGYVEVGAYAWAEGRQNSRLLVGHGYLHGQSPSAGFVTRTKDHMQPSDGGETISWMRMLKVY